MIVKNIIDEDFCNYKEPSMFIGFPKCSFKCELECPEVQCQNKGLAVSPDIEIDAASICERYINNPITKAIVCGGLEPFDTFDSLYRLISVLRTVYNCTDPIIIYTGYTFSEITEKITWLMNFPNIIVKMGRFRPNGKHRMDNVLGVELSSENQYALKVS